MKKIFCVTLLALNLSNALFTMKKIDSQETLICVSKKSILTDDDIVDLFENNEKAIKTKELFETVKSRLNGLQNVIEKSLQKTDSDISIRYKVINKLLSEHTKFSVDILGKVLLYALKNNGYFKKEPKNNLLHIALKNDLKILSMCYISAWQIECIERGLFKPYEVFDTYLNFKIEKTPVTLAQEKKLIEIETELKKLAKKPKGSIFTSF